jgi:hypothetical protein
MLFAEQLAKSLAHQGMVIGDQDFQGHRAENDGT